MDHMLTTLAVGLFAMIALLSFGFFVRNLLGYPRLIHSLEEQYLQAAKISYWMCIWVIAAFTGEAIMTVRDMRAVESMATSPLALVLLFGLISGKILSMYPMDPRFAARAKERKQWFQPPE